MDSLEENQVLSNPDSAWTDLQIRIKALELALKEPKSTLATLKEAFEFERYLKTGLI